MKKTSLKIISTLLFAGLICLNANATFKEHFDLGQNYLANYQYSGAITEFKSALRINYMDTSARIGLINSYLARGTDYANKEKAWDKAANDFRSALFYLKYYPGDSSVQNSAQAISQVTNNLGRCLEELNFDTNPKNRFITAQQLRSEGNFAAAGYEFNQTLGSKELQKDSFEQTAEIMKLLGNDLKTAEYYQKAVAIAPSDLSLRLEYAKILDKTKDDEKALKEYSYILERSTAENKDILYSLERIFKRKVENSPSNANLNANLGAIYQKEGQLDTALTYYKQAEALDPSNINTRINVGTLYQQKGDYRTAIKAYESVLILYPDNVNAILYRAQCHDKLGDHKLAQEEYKKVLALDPQNEYLKAQIVENAKKTMTIAEFTEYVKTNSSVSDPANVLYSYAMELHKNNKTTDALYLYREAIKIAGNKASSEMYVNTALAQAQEKDYENAIKTLYVAKENFPTDKSISNTLSNIESMRTDSILAMASNLFREKKYTEAVEEYKKITPETIESVVGIAEAYREMSDIDNSIVYYKKALDLKPVDSDIAYYIAVLYGEKQDFDSAKIYLNKALTFNKNNKDASEFLASILDSEKSNLLSAAIADFEGNNYSESLIKFDELIKKDPQNSYAYYYRGMIYDSQEKRSEAIADLKKAYSLNNDFLICNYLIASDYDTLKNYKEAMNYYKIYAESNADDDEYKKYAKARVEELKEYAKN